jgi:hypothetical protein
MYNHKFEAYSKQELKTFKCEDKIEMELLKYRIKGIALVNTWSDTVGCIPFTPFEIGADDITSKEEFFEHIKENINDGGFGSKDIYGAYIVINAVYINNVMVGSAEFSVDDTFIECNGYKLTEDQKDSLLEAWSIN